MEAEDNSPPHTVCIVPSLWAEVFYLGKQEARITFGLKFIFYFCLLQMKDTAM